jgi:hypothetical protein
LLSKKSLALFRSASFPLLLSPLLSLSLSYPLARTRRREKGGRGEKMGRHASSFLFIYNIE